MKGVGSHSPTSKEGGKEAPARHGSPAFRTGAKMHDMEPHEEIIADGKARSETSPADDEARYMECRSANPRAFAFMEEEACELADDGEPFKTRELAAKACACELFKNEAPFEDSFLPFLARSLVNAHPRLARYIEEDTPRNAGEANSEPPRG